MLLWLNLSERPSHPQWPWGWLAMSPAMDCFHIYLHNLIISAEDKLLHKLFQARLYIFICSFIFITPVSYYSAAENMRRIWNWSNVGGGHQQRAVLLESSVSSSSFFLFLSQKRMILKTKMNEQKYELNFPKHLDFRNWVLDCKLYLQQTFWL